LPADARLHIELNGVVQGVGFRPHAQKLAARRRLSGWARNNGGALELEVQGRLKACRDFVGELVSSAPAPAIVHGLRVREVAVQSDESGFNILVSSAASRRPRFIPADIGICDSCRSELLAPGDRRRDYPFINCALCGPRYTIIAGLPYDRESTSMCAFHLCLDCAFEYANEPDRRFHAEPNACPQCGPHYIYSDSDRSVAGPKAVAQAAAALEAGRILALKGIGGWHLACLATDESAVDKLRRLKPRPDKPMAVMVADLEQASRLGRIGPHEAVLLTGADRPIVLLEAAVGLTGVTGGLDTIGVMLPYAPVHVLLLQKIRGPLVMTSANRTGSPIVTDNLEAVAKLGGIADARLSHDRAILNGCDDSVVRRAAGRTVTIRSGRGRAPAAISLPGDYGPILACGADIKSSVCLAADGWAHLSQHLGSLDDPDCFDRYKQTTASLSALLDIRPAVVACDSHPDYLSVVFARGLGLPVKQVQHHHAHVVAAMAEVGLGGPVIGVAFDGSGWGTDGRVWGGEWLICSRDRFERAAHLKYVAMPGGELAVREPWRMAVAYLVDIGLDAEAIGRVLADIDPGVLDVVIKQLGTGINAPLTSSAGRLFDAAAALIAGCRSQSYEGHAASRLESLAAGDTGAYPLDLDADTAPFIIDPAPMIRAIIGDLAAGVERSEMAAKFHNGLADTICSVGRRLCDREGLDTIVLAGGVFVNARLLSRAVGTLESAGFTVLINQQVPINDGAISLGQAAVVAAGGGLPVPGCP